MSFHLDPFQKLSGPLSDIEAMRRALVEAKKGLGYVSPNPPVGCVILDSNRSLIGVGYHRKAGELHAEIEALKSVSDSQLLKGARLYVTLEPCNHKGRTPPCTEALLALPIEAVIYGCHDPNPLVQGKGARRLNESGLSCLSFGELEVAETREGKELLQELQELIEVFSVNMLERRPFVAVKVGQSLDGKLSFEGGESRWITNELARARGRSLRGLYDAVLIGAQTFIKDNPGLDPRCEAFVNKQNQVIILDPDLGTLAHWPKSNVAKIRPPESVLVLFSDSVRHSSLWGERKVSNDGVGWPQFAPIQLKEGFFPIRRILDTAYEKGIRSIFVEGGSLTLSRFLQEGLVDRFYGFIAPTFLGKSGISYADNFKVASFASRPKLESVSFETLGDNILVTGRWPRVM